MNVGEAPDLAHACGFPWFEWYQAPILGRVHGLLRQAASHLPVTQMSALQRSMSPRGQAAGILPGSYKDHFLVGLRSKDVAVSAAAVRVLCGLLHNKSVDPEVLDAAGADQISTFLPA